MAKKASPWFWEARNAWYVTLHGKQHLLGEHLAKTPPKKGKKGWNAPDEIEQAYRRLLDGGMPVQATAGDTVVGVLDDFITWCKENRAPRTAERYEELCQDFVTAEDDNGHKFGSYGVNQLTSKHVSGWLNQRPTWNSTSKRNAITAIMRALNWACKNRGLARNPIKGMEKPAAKTRTETITPDEFEKLLAAIPDQRFKDLMIVSYDSGGRPFEVKDLEARHVQLEKQRAIIPKEEAKGRKHARTIYFLAERSMGIIRRLCEANPTGLLFRNRLGNKWTGMAVKCRLEDLDHVLGRRVTHYSLRHSFVTRKLVAGVDSHVVAKLSGHRDTAMIDATYSHVADDYQYMLEQAAKDVKPKKEGEKK